MILEQCQMCQQYSPVVESHEELEDLGWVHEPDDDRWTCPRCESELEAMLTGLPSSLVPSDQYYGSRWREARYPDLICTIVSTEEDDDGKH